MAKPKKITVYGKQRKDIDPLVFLQVLLAIADDWDNPQPHTGSPDVFDAAIEDRLEPGQ